VAKSSRDKEKSTARVAPLRAFLTPYRRDCRHLLCKEFAEQDTNTRANMHRSDLNGMRIWKMIETKLNDDGTVSLSIEGESTCLTASELDRQIASLALIRSKMPHEVPYEPVQINEVVVNPPYAIRTDSVTKACLLRIRHGGFGWLNFELPSQEALNMRKIWKAIVDNLELDPYSNRHDAPEPSSGKLH
jgi:hypothetical protein